MSDRLSEESGQNWDHHPDLQPDPEIVKPLLLPLLDIGNREFKERFGQSSAAWRGKKPIQRNAVIALGNFKDKSAVPKLTEVLKRDPRPELRGTAAWALSRIGGEDAMRAIGEAAANEQDGNVLSMLQKAKERLSSSGSLPEKPQVGLTSDKQQEEQKNESTGTESNASGQPVKQEAAAWKPSPVTGLHGTPVFYDEVLTPIGTLTLCATEKGLCHIDFGAFHVREAHLQQWARTWIGEYRYEKTKRS